MIERKYLFHFIDSAFKRMTSDDGTPPTDTSFVRLGKYLEAYQEDLNPQTRVFSNILGEQIAILTGYQVSSTVEPYYADEGDPLWEKLQQLANERVTGDGVLTTRVDGLMDESGNVLWAYIEECRVIPQSIGGDTSGVQIPFQVINNGNRHKVNFDLKTKKATKYTA